MISLFGTSGIRGPVDTLFTPQFCFDLGRTFAQFLSSLDQAGLVAIGFDPRQSSPQIAASVTAGLLHENREVISLGSVPVPAVNYALISSNFSGSIMVTGSHIDVTSNGLKFFALKEEISKEHEAQISRLYDSLKNQIPHKPIKISIQNSTSGIDNYVELLLSLADKPLPKLKLIVDTGNGGQTEVMRRVLPELGFEVSFLNADQQQSLISRDTETNGSFADLQQEVVSSGADLGIGFDSDGDRVIFVDHTSQFVPGDLTGVLLAKWLPGNIIVTPVNTSNLIDNIDKEIVRTKVGSPFVVSAIKKYGANFGFESNGGGIHADVMLSRDGGVSMIRLLNILKWSGKNLHTLLSSFPRTFIRRSKFSCPPDQFQAILSAAPKFLHSQAIDTTDGVKLILDDSTWILFRPSSNAPEFRIFVESNSITASEQLMQDALLFAKKLVHGQS